MEIGKSIPLTLKIKLQDFYHKLYNKIPSDKFRNEKYDPDVIIWDNIVFSIVENRVEDIIYDFHHKLIRKSKWK